MSRFDNREVLSTPFDPKGVAPQARGDDGTRSNAIPLSPPSCGRGRQAREGGFTLVELMIAMILGLIVIAGVTSVFLAGQRSFRTNDALGNVESGSRVSFELMARDIREAGSTGCDSTSDRVANVLNNSGTAWWANFDNALHGYEGSQTDPAITTGTGEGERVADTDSLQVLGTGIPVTILDDSEPAGNLTLNAAAPGLKAADVAIICSPDHSTIVQVSSYNGALAVAHNTGASPSPGNCSMGLGFPTVCSASGNVYSFPKNSSIAKLSASDWYIGNNPSGGRSLYHRTLFNSGAGVASQAQEVVRNVTDMQITYLQGGTSFVDASAVTDWGEVTAARVTLRIESTFKRAGVDEQAISREYSATTTVRNRVL